MIVIQVCLHLIALHCRKLTYRVCEQSSVKVSFLAMLINLNIENMDVEPLSADAVV